MFAIDFLKNGISYNRTNEQLLYNFACACELLGDYEKAMRFFQYCQVVKPGWTDAIFGETIAHFKLRHFEKAKNSVELALSNF